MGRMLRTVEILKIPALFDTDTLAQYLRVHKSMIRQYRAARRIPAPDLMISNRPRWKPETIAKLVEDGRV